MLAVVGCAKCCQPPWPGDLKLQWKCCEKRLDCEICVVWWLRIIRLGKQFLTLDHSKGRRLVLLSPVLIPPTHTPCCTVTHRGALAAPGELTRIKLSSLRLPWELNVWRKQTTESSFLSAMGSWHNISLNWIYLDQCLEGQHYKWFSKLFSGTWAFFHLYTN